ncbi:MAG: undecaprenyldiphospho-muramoylpentapeptide beta-N-acetylglucosaminyltransferase [Verrucomicrobiota bacterium]
MSLKVIVACGGTGGHLFPGIAVAEVLQERGHECLVLISEKKIDALAVKGHDHLRFETVEAVAMPKLLSPKIVPFAFKMWRTIGQCRKIIREFGADAVLGMGGFTSLPPVWAGKRHGAKTFIHDSNAIPGRANKLTARFTDTVCLGLKECARYFEGKSTKVTGTPVRSSLKEKIDRKAAREEFGLGSAVSHVLLVMGGSQGAQGINRAVVEAFRELPEGLGVIHLSGPDGFEETKAGYGETADRVHVAPFCHEMGAAYAASDFAIARSGASSLTELSHFGLPSILVPYPFAADDHQTKNAEVFTSADAAVLMKQDEFNAEKVAGILGGWMTDKDGFEALRERVFGLAVPNVAGNICDLIEEACR